MKHIPDVNIDSEEKKAEEYFREVARAQTKKLGLEFSDLNFAKYTSTICAHCNKEEGTKHYSFHLLPNDKYPAPIWILYKVCEECDDIFTEDPRSATEKIADTLTVWLYGRGKDWTQA